MKIIVEILAIDFKNWALFTTSRTPGLGHRLVKIIQPTCCGDDIRRGINRKKKKENTNREQESEQDMGLGVNKYKQVRQMCWPF